VRSEEGATSKEREMGHVLSRFTIGFGFLVVVMVSLTACSAPTTSAPPPTQQAARQAPTKTGRRDERRGAATTIAIAAGCEGYAAWMKDPAIKATIKNTDLWPELVAAGQNAANGTAIDQARVQEIAAQLDAAAGTIKRSDAAAADKMMTETSSRAMGLASRLAEGLSAGSLDQTGAEDAVSRLQDAIAAYETEAAAQNGQCG
jgi:hypothetical protein